MALNYEAAKALRDGIQARCDAAGATLKSFPKSGPLGLTPDHIKATLEYQAARRAYDSAFAELRAFNAQFVKLYARQIRSERNARFAGGDSNV